MTDAIARPLSGRVALVTGGGQRLGREIALGLGRLGADVAVHFHGSRAGADQTVSAIKVDGNRAMAFGADLTDASAIAPLVKAIEAGLGDIDVLINSAAIYLRADFLQTPLDTLDRQWALNARAPYLLTQAVAPGMKARGRGDVVNVLDVGGAINAWRHYSAYCMTKAALASLTACLALELAPQIRVNGVAPGTVLPPVDLSAEALEQLKGRIPQQRFGSPADVVDTVGFLVSGPRFITGQILAVDGGRSRSGS
ncbi:MAG: short-chain dehydrogenase/reductase [Myxococcaceae bacterium]|nr:short-chain dehydrogenase/reductase [Myxococcaceae bacterium]